MPDIIEKLIDLLTGYSLDTYEDIQYVADELIAKGVVPVVRCKDCRWSRTNQKDDADVYYCELRTGRAYHSGDFCSYGAKKEDDGK